MMMKSAANIQFILQGLIVAQINRHNFQSVSFRRDETLSRSFWYKYEDGIKNLTYAANKCLYHNQGGAIAEEYFPQYLDKAYDYTQGQLTKMLDTAPYVRREENLPIVLNQYLSKYHSDYRWQVKLYKTPEEKLFRI